ncbi:MAG: hypothetical protein ACMXX9_00025 [Candidatus Woesearchaeota archaeon]
MSETAFGNAIEFMAELGIFDTVLPFLLVFTMLFAFLEKTKIYGTDKFKTEGGTVVDMPKKNLNAMTAFVISFFVVASTQLVALISQVISQAVLVIVLVFLLLLTLGSFEEQTDKPFFIKGGWGKALQAIVFISISLIFLNSLGWLDLIFEFIQNNWDNQAVAALIMVLLLIGFMAAIVWERKPHVGEEKKD